ncbi:hypothetical protein OBBRIDRAFT_340902 [Obba rivulosa]|uniref:Uncharacterized protein n=1 Tax=Obba rivulosa TaxID=1052685 RepID=A0A8E2DJT9_9APHY|nr:hypothetical protein OBBRIDRAFT_340902 [Obba rivulosa]
MALSEAQTSTRDPGPDEQANVTISVKAIRISLKPRARNCFMRSFPGDYTISCTVDSNTEEKTFGANKQMILLWELEASR